MKGGEGREWGRKREDDRTFLSNNRGRDQSREALEDEEDNNDDDDDDSRILNDRQDNSVPSYLLRGSMTETHSLHHPHPLVLRTAISALRFAMRHPLTNHSTVRVHV